MRDSIGFSPWRDILERADRIFFKNSTSASLELWAHKNGAESTQRMIHAMNSPSSGGAMDLLSDFSQLTRTLYIPSTTGDNNRNINTDYWC